MIKKLKKKFIILATVSMFVLMSFLIIIMNSVNYLSVIREADTVLNIISQQKPVQNRRMSPEVPFESRYFTAIVSNDKGLLELELSNIVTVNADAAGQYITTALEKENDRGFIDHFRYVKISDQKITKIIFLDCGRKLDAFFIFMCISTTVGLLGCIIVFLVFIFVAGRIVKPISESYKKQKQFITDASHEIRTPLTIINSNLDLLESDFGENDCLGEIKKQTTSLTQLTNELVYLSKMEEGQKKEIKMQFSLSDLLWDTATAFNATAASQDKVYVIDIQPNVNMTGNPDNMKKLVSILLDNAMKYSPKSGKVCLAMSTQKKKLNLIVFNTTQENITKEKTESAFERFYRSRDSEAEGHGIGLSIAKVLVESQKGKIWASTENGFDFKVTAEIPMS